MGGEETEMVLGRCPARADCDDSKEKRALQQAVQTEIKLVRKASSDGLPKKV